MPATLSHVCTLTDGNVHMYLALFALMNDLQLLIVVSTVVSFCSVLLSRLKTKVDFILAEEQAGFWSDMSNRSTHC